MRVTGGRARGVRLDVPKRGVRPALDRMREAVFSQIGSRIEGVYFLDLFAGCGSYGLEALSRGANGGVFVEKNRHCAKSVEKNLGRVCKSMDTPLTACRICVSDVFKWRSGEGPVFDFIFVDPPYEILEPEAPRILHLVSESLKDESSARVVFEAPGGIEFDLRDWVVEREFGNRKSRSEPNVRIIKR